MASFLQRLKGRELFQWALAYLAGAWLVFQGIEVLAEPWSLSAGLQRVLHVLLGIGFLLTLVLAWYHGERGRQSVGGVELLLLAGLLVIAGVAVAALGRGPNVETADAPLEDWPVATTQKSVAVLPFVNIGGDPANEYFSDGITVEIISHLSRIADLKVISRTSAFQYKDASKGLREIGEELGVASIVEGEVQKAGDRVRVNAQLISTRTDQHVWSEQYDRQLTDVFAIQSDIAQKIATELQVTLTAAERQRIEQRPTESLEAYEYFVRSMDIRLQGGTEASSRLAVQLAENAVGLDPEFARAWALLSELHSRRYWYFWDRSEERLAKARDAAFEAFKLRPGLGEAHRALGFYYYWGLLDYDRALEQFSLALNVIPNDELVWSGIGFVQRRQGRWQEATRNLRKAVELNPRATQTLSNLADTYARMRRYPEAERVYDQALVLSPEGDHYYEGKAWVYLQWHGDTERAREILEGRTQRSASASTVFGYRIYVGLELLERKYAKALEVIAATSGDVFETQFHFVPKALVYANVFGLMGQSDRERAYSDSARAVLEAQLRGDPADARLHSSLGIAYARLGRRGDAIREAELGVELMPVEKEAWKGIYRVEDLARVYMMVGEHDAAIDRLDYLLSIPGELSVPLLGIDPTWDPLRDHPRFAALLKKYAPGQ